MRAYIFHSVHELLFDRVCAELVNQKILTSLSGFVWGLQDEVRLQKQGRAHYEQLNVFTRDLLPYVNAAPDIDFLCAFEKDYGVDISRLIFAERLLREGRRHEETLALIEQGIRFVQNALERAKPDVIISEDVSCLMSYLHWAVATKHGIPFVAIGSARIPKRIAISYEPSQRWPRTEARFEELRKQGLSPEQRRLAETQLNNFTQRPSRPQAVDVMSRFSPFRLADLAELYNISRAYLVDPKNPTAPSPLWALRRRLNRVFNDLRTRHYFESPPETERYLLFPLHFQPEASTLVRAPHCLDQPAIVENLALNLPADLRLYVKEHRVSRGRRAPEYYQRLKAIPGVRLINSQANTWELIQKSQGVAVITGTAGWEAMLFGKPAFVIGNTFYDHFPKITSLANVPRLKWNLHIRDTLEQFQPDRELLLCYLAAMLETTYPGEKANYRKVPSVLDESNIASLAEAIRHELANDKRWPKASTHADRAQYAG